MTCTLGTIKNPKSIIENPLFTPSSPPATRKLPPRPTIWKARVHTRHNLTTHLCNQLLPKPPAPPTRYAWLAPGLQTSSSSNRRRKDVNASSPRLKVPPVISPQWAQHAPVASQSARLVSSPQDRQCINDSICDLLFSCANLPVGVGHKASYEEKSFASFWGA